MNNRGNPVSPKRKINENESIKFELGNRKKLPISYSQGEKEALELLTCL